MLGCQYIVQECCLPSAQVPRDNGDGDFDSSFLVNLIITGFNEVGRAVLIVKIHVRRRVILILVVSAQGEVQDWTPR